MQEDGQRLGDEVAHVRDVSGLLLEVYDLGF